MFRLKFRWFLLSCVLGLFACGGGGSDSGAGSTEAAQLGKVLVIGDSISTGFGLATPWVTLLEGKVPNEIVNKSRSGRETPEGLSILGTELALHQPAIVLILLGTNDAIRGSVSGAISNLQSMVNLVRQNNAIPYVATLPVITRSTQWQARAGEISNGIRGLSNANVVSVRAAIGNGQGLLADGIHPNDAGQGVIANEFASHLN